MLSQTCPPCYEILSFIYSNNYIDKIKEKGIRIDMVNKDNEFAVDYMIKALDWLAKNKDPDRYGEQESVTPLLVIKSIDGIESVLVGANKIIEYMKNFK